MKMSDNIERILYSEEEIQACVKRLGAQITADYAGVDKLMLISVLRGSYIFMADLSRAIDLPCLIDFMIVSSYGSGTASTGQVEIRKDVSFPMEGYHVIVVEDILDSGNTLHYLMDLFRARKAASIRICTLLDKPERRVKPITADYYGFVVPDAFLVGYGLDYDQQYRNLPYIGILKEEVYRDK